ncbi:hypothetical protein RSAG8_00823, partial [Rhizoctonia solani AG-8 WAC10335]
MVPRPCMRTSDCRRHFENTDAITSTLLISRTARITPITYRDHVTDTVTYTSLSFFYRLCSSGWLAFLIHRP